MRRGEICDIEFAGIRAPIVGSEHVVLVTAAYPAGIVPGSLLGAWVAARAGVRRTTLISWGFLTVGIVLGAWWSYSVLGWGGFWGWDPVENASLLPWLTATAFIHSVMVQERRGMLRVWNLSLVLATFCLTILGTFLILISVIVITTTPAKKPPAPYSPEDTV